MKLKVMIVLKEQLKNAENINSLEKLTNQGINIFDQNSDFYTDICFHFKSPIDGKDIPLKDRLKLFFPNITLCNEGCFIKGVNLTTWKAMCQCTLNNLVNNNIFGNNILLQKSLGEFKEIFTKTRLAYDHFSGNDMKKPFPRGKGNVRKRYHLRLRAASAFFLRLTLGFS